MLKEKIFIVRNNILEVRREILEKENNGRGRGRRWRGSTVRGSRDKRSKSER